MFGTQTPEGEFPSPDDPTGVSGGTFFTSSIPNPLAGGIFADGFESGDTSAWSDGSYNRIPPTTTTRSDQDKKLPVLSPEELRAVIELFESEDDFDTKTADLFSERFGVLEPLPPARGTYFFDEFESFR
ncbi:hypothetical protein IID19_04040 [Patescibacteria group bacterium]|nr:hypothetical protein [Patescibacteria group bacterium]